jgi:hypothetical protein
MLQFKTDKLVRVLQNVNSNQLDIAYHSNIIFAQNIRLLNNKITLTFFTHWINYVSGLSGQCHNRVVGTRPQDESLSFRPSFLHSAQFRQLRHFIVSGYETAHFKARSTHLKLANQRGALGHPSELAVYKSGRVAHKDNNFRPEQRSFVTL